MRKQETNLSTCQAAFEMAGVLPAQHYCCWFVYFAFSFFVMIGELSIRFVRQLAQLGAPRLQLQCLFQHFWLTTMPVYLHRS